MVRIRRKGSKDPQEEGVEADEAVEVQQEPGQDQEVPSSDTNNRASVKDRIKDIENGKSDDDDDTDVVKCKPTSEESDDDDDDSASQPSLESYQQKKELMGRLEEALAQLPKELREEAVDRFIQNVDDANERAIFVRPLLMHSYHLPGYTWQQDWWQYLSNNHPLFGIFCHHRHHPLKSGVRVASLVGSILFGLAITNIIYLAFVFTDYDPDQEYISFSTNVTRTGLQEDFDQTVSTISVTSGNVALWTVGALIHGFYDNCIWALAACSCLVQEGSRSQREQERLRRYQSSGAFLVNLATIVVVAIATFACMLRAALAAGEDEDEIMDALTGNLTSVSSTTSIGDSHQVVYAELQDIQQNQNFQDYDFVVSYLVELVLNYLVYYPLVGTILFTGVLNCCGRFKFPVLGGRPFELKQLREKKLSEMEDPSEEGIEVEWNDEETGGANSPPSSSRRINKQQDSEAESDTGSADASETPKEDAKEQAKEAKPKK